jgi:hypothetical protein
MLVFLIALSDWMLYHALVAKSLKDLLRENLGEDVCQVVCGWHVCRLA